MKRAMHEFLRYQITGDQTSDPMEIGRHVDSYLDFRSPIPSIAPPP